MPYTCVSCQFFNEIFRCWCRVDGWRADAMVMWLCNIMPCYVFMLLCITPDAFQQLRDIKKKHSKTSSLFMLISIALEISFFNCLICYMTKSQIHFCQKQSLMTHLVKANSTSLDTGYSGMTEYTWRGVICYVKSTLPARGRPDVEFENPLESFVLLDVTFNDRRWAVIGMYSPPPRSKVIYLLHILSNLLTRLVLCFKNFIYLTR